MYVSRTVDCIYLVLFLFLSINVFCFCEFFALFICKNVLFLRYVIFLCVKLWIGTSDEESTGEEYAVGEYVLADLEFGSPEEAGLIAYLYM